MRLAPDFLAATGSPPARAWLRGARIPPALCVTLAASEAALPDFRELDGLRRCPAEKRRLA